MTAHPENRAKFRSCLVLAWAWASALGGNCTLWHMEQALPRVRECREPFPNMFGLVCIGFCLIAIPYFTFEKYMTAIHLQLICIHRPEVGGYHSILWMPNPCVGFMYDPGCMSTFTQSSCIFEIKSREWQFNLESDSCLERGLTDFLSQQAQLQLFPSYSHRASWGLILL